MRSWGIALCLVLVGCAGAAPAVAPSTASVERVRRCGHCSATMPEPLPGWTIYGQVVARRSRMPIADALVVAREAVSLTIAQFRTNALGQFYFTSLPPGRYEIVVINGTSADTWPDVIVEPGRRTALTIRTAP